MKKTIAAVLLVMMALVSVSTVSAFDRDATNWNVRGSIGDRTTGEKVSIQARLNLQRGVNVGGSLVAISEGTRLSANWNSRDNPVVVVDTAKTSTYTVDATVQRGRDRTTEKVTVQYTKNAGTVKVSGKGFSYTVAV